ncbi:hypothetical protein [Terribacillus saccharophilus]|nr:hypothetical protein [Terribacillus saccharophilus]MEC0288907.1 hypothetical protein [Terribacillus saccharophilus]
MGYNHGTGHLSKPTQAIINQREENNKILKKEAEKNKEQKD